MSGNAWTSRAWKVSPDGSTVFSAFGTASAAQGLAVDKNGDVWISSGWTADRPFLTHLKSDGTFLGRVDGVPNLLVNPSAEAAPEDDEIAGWTEVEGTD